MSPRQKVWWYRTVKIWCPGCTESQTAEEMHYEGDPFSTYLHICDNCDYTIMESEWEYAQCQTN